MEQSPFISFWSFDGPLSFAVTSRREVHAAQLVTALALYQVDHGNPPAKLEDIVPAYLAELPVNPSAGGPFVYRIFAGEKIHSRFGQSSTLALGQAYTVNANNPPLAYPVPFWPKQKEDQP